MDGGQKTQITAKSCFVRMPIAGREPLRSYFGQVVELLAKELAFDVVRMDRKGRSGRIDVEIEGDIGASVFCIADVTGDDPNVFYEIGYAKALKKPVIITSYQADSTRFDKGQQRYVVYHTLIELEQRLRNEIIDILKSNDQTRGAGHRDDAGDAESAIIGTS